MLRKESLTWTILYGRAIGFALCLDIAPINTPTNTTILSSIQLDGKIEYTIYSSGTTGIK